MRHVNRRRTPTHQASPATNTMVSFAGFALRRPFVDKFDVRFDNVKAILREEDRIGLWPNAQTTELSSVRKMTFACRGNGDT